MSEFHASAALRAEVFARAEGCCEYCRCQVQFSASPFSVEHILPRSRGGKTASENLALACEGCNGSKARKVAAPDPITGRSVPLFHPRRQRWTEHFRWSRDRLQIIGITPTGRATVEALALNRAHLRNLRRLLRLAKMHPPGDF